jgi:outer membrane protein
VLVWSLAAASTSHAADLMQVWQAALQNDKDHAVAGAAHRAAAPKRELAGALWRPQVGLTGSVGVASNQTDATGAQFAAPGFGSSTGVAFSTSVNNGTAARVAVSAVQPLYNPERRAQQQQLGLQVDLAELQWQDARQALMLRTAQRYLDLALASEALRVLQHQMAAVQSASTEAVDRFKLGAVPVTETYEAQARLAQVRAQWLAAQDDWQNKRQALADSTGLTPDGLQALAPGERLPTWPDAGLQAWLNQADGANAGLGQQRLAVQIAQQETTKFTRYAQTTLDLVAQVSRDHLGGHGDFGQASNAASNRAIGVQVTIPLFTGGYRSARQSESLRLVDQRTAELEAARQQVAQQVRATWSGLKVGEQRVAALAEGLKASLARRDATRTGQQVGHRTTLDVLNAENDSAVAQLAVVQARSDWLLNRLRLLALAGQLDESALQLAQATLVPATQP